MGKSMVFGGTTLFGLLSRATKSAMPDAATDDDELLIIIPDDEDAFDRPDEWLDYADDEDEDDGSIGDLDE